MTSQPHEDPALDLRVRVASRIEAFRRDGDEGPLLDDEALAEADALWKASLDGAGTVPLGVLYLIAMVHWHRYEAQPGNAGISDLEDAAELFAELLPEHADLVPAVARYGFDTRRPGESGLTDRAVAMVRLAQRWLEPVGLCLTVAVLRRALSRLPAGHARRPGLTADLAVGVHTWFQHTGAPAELDEARRLLRDALEMVEAPTHHASILSNLAGVLNDRFSLTGDVSDLAEAVEAARAAAAATPPSDPLTAARLVNMAGSLRRRYEHTGELADLTEAIATFRTAVARPEADDEHRRVALSGLSSALWLRFQETRGTADLEEALDGWRSVVAGAGDRHPGRASHLSSIGSALQARYRLTGRRADIDEAAEAGRAALTALPDGHPDRLPCLTNLANALRLRYDGFGERADLDAALEVAGRAVEGTPAGHPGLAGRLYNLGLAQHTRATAHDDHDALAHGIGSWRQATEVRTAPATLLALSGTAWGDAAAAAGMWASASDGYARVANVFPRVVWAGVSRVSREHLLRYWSRVATDASACAVADGSPDGAVQALERGRAVLWSQLLDSRGDFTQLRAAHPRLADRLRAVRHELDNHPEVDTGLWGHQAAADWQDRQTARPSGDTPARTSLTRRQ